jgi:hypothetical protein
MVNKNISWVLCDPFGVGSRSHRVVYKGVMPSASTTAKASMHSGSIIAELASSLRQKAPSFLAMTFGLVFHYFTKWIHYQLNGR